jgi:hypothetical protein
MADDTTTLTAEAPAAVTPAVTPEPVATPTPAPDSWTASLPEGLKADKTLARYKDLPAAAQALIEQHKMIKSGIVRAPGPNATPEEKAFYREAAGIPPAPSDYDLQLPKNIPLDERSIDSYRQAFYEAGVSSAAAQKIAAAYVANEQQRVARMEETWLAELDQMANEWGKPLFDLRAQNIQRYLSTVLSPKDQQWLDASRMVNNPVLFRALWQAAEDYAEDHPVPGLDGSAGPEAFDAKIAANREAILKAPEGSPERQRLNDERIALFKARYPEPR